MANPGQTRNLWWIVVQKFVQSLTPRSVPTKTMGKDYLGNIYYEIEGDRSIGKKTVRWFKSSEKDLDDVIGKELPAEWDSWLRGKRQEPPTEEEIAHNLALIKMKQSNAAKLEVERVKELTEAGKPILPETPAKGAESFPKYKEYHQSK